MSGNIEPQSTKPVLDSSSSGGNKVVVEPAAVSSLDKVNQTISAKIAKLRSQYPGLSLSQIGARFPLARIQLGLFESSSIPKKPAAYTVLPVS